MFHQRLLPTLLYAGCIALFTTSCGGPPRSVYGDAGFKEAFFSKIILAGFLTDPNCVKVRFYNARRSANDKIGTVMAIGVRSDSADLYNANSALYQLSDKLIGSGVSVIRLDRSQARQACKYVSEAHELSYCTEFTRDQLTVMLNTNGCDGVRLVSEKLVTNNDWSMRLFPVKIAGGIATDLQAPPSKLCTEPCPSFCGPPSKYVNG